MGMNPQKTPRLKYLLDKVPPGFMVDTAWLRGNEGIDPKSIHEYVERGWLERVVRGVYRRPLPESAREPADADWQVPLLSLQWIMDKNVHLGGESALDLAGYSHYLSLGNHSGTHYRLILPYRLFVQLLDKLVTLEKYVMSNQRQFACSQIHKRTFVFLGIPERRREYVKR